MGQLGKKRVGTAARAITAVLRRAYADEWFAHYNYQLVANTLRGHRSPATIAVLAEKSRRAFDRSNRLIARVLELGGQPIRKMGDLADVASDKPFRLPDRLDDVDAVLKAVLDAERTSIRTYGELATVSADKDVVTHALAVEFLTAATAGEENIERLLGDAAPGMTGR